MKQAGPEGPSRCVVHFSRVPKAFKFGFQRQPVLPVSFSLQPFFSLEFFSKGQFFPSFGKFK
jgi:hypothetical protein